MAELGFERISAPFVQPLPSFPDSLWSLSFPNHMLGPWKVEAASVSSLMLAQCLPCPGWHVTVGGGQAAPHSLGHGGTSGPLFQQVFKPTVFRQRTGLLCPLRMDRSWLFTDVRPSQVGRGALKGLLRPLLPTLCWQGTWDR